MKKILLSCFALASIFTNAQAQFTADNIVVLKLTSLSGYGRVATVSLEEYATSGGAVVSSTNISNSGAGNDFYLPYGSASNQSTAYLNLSTDKQLITLYGYNTLPTATPASTELFAAGALNRTLVVVNGTKTVTKLITDAHSGTNVSRSALAYPLSGGTYGVYLAGHGSGIKYATYDPITTPATPTLSSASVVNSLNTIDIKIYEGKLYATSQVTLGVSSFDADLPTAAASISSTFAVTNAQDFVVFNLGANKIMYVAAAANTATAADGIFKYYSTDNGSTWTAAGKVDGNTTTVADNGFRGLSGRLEAGKVTLYGVTSNNNQNSVLKIVDNVAANVAISNLNATVTTLATAPAGSGFRGVAFTPGSTVTLPVTLSKSLAGRVTGSSVALNWATASETNSKEFQLAHATNGKDFTTIGARATNSPNGTNYNFTHFNAAAGTNYYQLKQVDNNGTTTTFDPISVEVKLSSAVLTVVNHTNAVVANLTVPNAAKNVAFSVVDINGRVLAKTVANVASGSNEIKIPVTLTSGIYILKVAGGNVTENKKFVKN